MPVYEVSFFKDIVNSCGKEFRVRQRALQIRSAKTLERAVEAAKRRFARLERVADWRLHASDVEVEILDEPDPAGSSAPAGRFAGRGPSLGRARPRSRRSALPTGA
jgi:hypothetical protein